MTSEISTDTINLVLNELIKKKSKRDGVKFTSSKLANELDLPRSSIFRLIHPDKAKRMTNPTIGTLIKIVDFFKTDGINVSIDDFVGLRKTVVDVQMQEVELLRHSIFVPIYTWYGEQYHDKSSISLQVNKHEQSKNLVAFLAEEDIKPIFKKGSVFVVDKDVPPEDDNIIGIRLEVNGLILIRKYHKKNNKISISLLDQQAEEMDLLSAKYYDIIGVVVQIIAKT